MKGFRYFQNAGFTEQELANFRSECVKPRDKRDVFDLSAAKKTGSELSPNDAVQLAEQFIARNGYTDASPDKNTLSHESLERTSDVDHLLADRHDSLESRAFGYFGGGHGEAGWTICFRYKKVRVADSGRAVTMNLDGTAMHVEHQDIMLRACHGLPKPIGSSK